MHDMHMLDHQTRGPGHDMHDQKQHRLIHEIDGNRNTVEGIPRILGQWRDTRS